jgi:hypothetical protein
MLAHAKRIPVAVWTGGTASCLGTSTQIVPDKDVPMIGIKASDV